MNLFELQKSLYTKNAILTNDLVRRKNMMKHLWDNNDLKFKKQLDSDCVICSSEIDYAEDDDVNALSVGHICDITLRFGNTAYTILISVFKNKLHFNMSWFHMEDCRKLFGEFVMNFMNDMSIVSDIKFVELKNIKSGCVKEWCKDYGFEIAPDFMPKPIPYNAADMIIKR